MREYPVLSFLVVLTVGVILSIAYCVDAARRDTVEQPGQYVFVRPGAFIENETLRNGVYMVVEGGEIRDCRVGQHAVVILRGGKVTRCVLDGGWIVGDSGVVGGENADLVPRSPDNERSHLRDALLRPGP